ncbi:MAG: homoserine dehydrogenase [Clostridiales bacterium]|nr:homoserine dehydrogenase [Clostridiales bacterium]
MRNAAIMGYGVVGSGVFELLRDSDVLVKKLGRHISVKKVLDLRSFPGDIVEPFLTHEPDEILNDDSITIVVETMGGLNPAYEYTKQALSSGKHVITSNKELVSVHGSELLSIANENNSRYLFEASVGGGIPIIRALKHTLLSEEVSQITGILNGTTNYILTQMYSLGLSFADTLRQAQELGFAEREPSSDIEGFDASRKLAILLSLCVNKQVNYSRIPTEGISQLTYADFICASKYGSVIKLIGRGDIKDGVIEAIVAPFLVQSGASILAEVGDVYNAITITSSMSDDNTFYGKGAGKLPTAGAIVGDIADILTGNLETVEWGADEAEMAEPTDAIYSWMVRATATKEKIHAAARGLLDDSYFFEPGIENQTSFVTLPLKHGDFLSLLTNLRSEGVTIENTLRIFADR